MSTGRISGFDVSPDGRTVVVIGDASGTPQPWVFPIDEPEAARLIPVDGAVQRCAWRPDGSRFAVLVDPDGREDHRILEVSPDSGELHEVCVEPGVRHELGVPLSAGNDPYSPDGRWLAYASTARTGDAFDVHVRDLGTGADRIVLRAGEDVPADRYLPVLFSPDSRQLLVIRLHQNTEHVLYVSDVDTGAVRRLIGGDGPGKYLPVAWRAEGIYLCATHDGDFTGFALLSPSGELSWIDTPDRDVEHAVVSADGRRLVWFVNEDGFTVLRTNGGRAVPGLPPGVAAAEFGLLGLAPRLSGDSVVVLLGRAGVPPQLWRVRLPDGPAVPVGPVPEPTIAPPTVVRSGLIYRPAGDGPFPAVLIVHGGPEVQAVPGSESMIDRLVANGIAVLASNIRGSSGFGLRYQRSIYRDWGGGDVEDLRAAAEFLRGLSWLDPDRLAVYGASYGGFAALNCLTRLPEFWRAGVAECAVADLVADVRAFPPTWRRRARDWVGDPDDPADHARLVAGSPLSYVEHVRAPVLLVHGTNDTRADIGSVDAFHAESVRLGKAVEYHRVVGAGHNLYEQVDTESLIFDWLVKQLLGG